MKLGDYPVGSRLRMEHGVDDYEYIVLLKTAFLAQHPTIKLEYAVPMLELPTLSIVWDESERLNFIPVEE
jgi:hypothetical protein